MQKVYNRVYWENEPSHVTPLSETNLNRMDAALDTVDTRVVELAGYQERAETAAQQAEASAQDSDDYASESETHATQSASSATRSEDYSKLSESHNHGNTGVRAGENTDNAMYWSQQAQAHAQTASTYEAAVQAAETQALARIRDALDETEPIWSVSLQTGHAYYSGGRFTFVLNTNGHLLWEVTA